MVRKFPFVLIQLVVLNFLSLTLFAEPDSHGNSSPPVTGSRPVAPPKISNEEYLSVIVDQYKDCSNNYTDAEDFCYVRAQKMADAMIKLHEKHGIDPKGPDATWGTEDDLVKKILIRYPHNYKWWYHIAACVVKDGVPRVCDPIDEEIELRTEDEWGYYFSTDEDYKKLFNVCKKPVAHTPDAGECHVEIRPITQYNPTTSYHSLDEIRNTIKWDQDSLNDRIKSLDAMGKEAYPKKDSDKDGIPDTIDHCDDTPAGRTVNYRGC